LKAELESNSSYYTFKRLHVRRFQHGLHSINLHRLTVARSCDRPLALVSSPFTRIDAVMERRKLTLKAKFESGSS
jgi:hypothetical protein